MAALAFAKTSLGWYEGRSLLHRFLCIVGKEQRNTHLVNLKLQKMEQKIGQFNDIHFNMYHKTTKFILDVAEEDTIRGKTAFKLKFSFLQSMHLLAAMQVFLDQEYNDL